MSKNIKVVAIIQARHSSTRLPDKVLEELVGQPMLARVVNRTRRAALSTSPIPFEYHIHWFEEKLASDNTVILILESDTVPVGQIRFDLDHRGNAEIDIYVASTYRGHSLGTYVLREGAQRYVELNKERAKAVVGHIRPENLPSCRAFEKAGFGHMGADIVHGVPLVRFVWLEGEAQ
ncbi:GNAT family N-acetyltransferase [Chloroflexota bacterium]